MKLYESEAKMLLKEMGLPVPRGHVARSPGEAARITEGIGGAVVLKAQVLVAGRGKLGGIRFAESPEQAESVAKELLGARIGGIRPSSLLVEQKEDVDRELYLGIAVDRSSAAVVAMASSRGGMDVEEAAREAPHEICRVAIDVRRGLAGFQARTLAWGMGLRRQPLIAGTDLASILYDAFVRYDSLVAELNPVALTKQGELVALDAVLDVDDDALYRQPRIAAMVAAEPRVTELEAQAARSGFSFVELDGVIGIVGNGAGITMATLDLVKLYGGAPASFLDIGGGVAPEVMKRAMEVALSVPRCKVLLVNIFAGINRCDDVALGIVDALAEKDSGIPVVTRLVGTSEERGREILRDVGLTALEDLRGAVEKAIRLAGEGV